MKKVILFLIINGLALGKICAQEANQKRFCLDSERVQVYDFEADMEVRKGTQLEILFEDDYKVKLTNKSYKVSLLFEDTRFQSAQESIVTLMENAVISQSKNRTWKKMSAMGKLMYQVQLKKKKLKMMVNRAEMTPEAFAEISDIGETFISDITGTK